MQLEYCHIQGGNFGDDLNLSLWARLFPDIRVVHPEIRFYGIGTILGGRQPPGPKVILGSGIGYRGDALPDPWRKVYWVRGPRTAERLGIDPALGIGDGALLWPALRVPRSPMPGRVGLVPHFHSIRRFDWAGLAARARLHLVDPRLPPEEVATQLRSCERVLCESLHGAICADVMGIPWRAIVLARRFNDFKWRDWLDGLGLELAPAEMPVELLDRLSPAKAIGNALNRLVDRGGPRARQRMRPLRAAGERKRQVAAGELARLSAQLDAFQLGDRGRVARQREAMLEQCAAFARDHGTGFTP